MYENQGGLLVKPGTNECAGYIFNFGGGHGAYGPNKVETPQGAPTQAEIDAHNCILSKAERDAMIQKGVGTFYLSERKKDICYGGNVYQAKVSQWVGWNAPWSFVRKGMSYGFCSVVAYYVWFTGPDGKKWYGVNKGVMDCFTGRRLKTQN